MTLQKFICGNNGKPKRGAISRVAEFQRVSYTTVKRWLDNPNIVLPISRRRKIQDMIHSRLDLSPKVRRDKNHARK